MAQDISHARTVSVSLQRSSVGLLRIQATRRQRRGMGAICGISALGMAEHFFLQLATWRSCASCLCGYCLLQGLKLQGKYDCLVEFGSTAGGTCAYSVDLFGVPVVATVNMSTKNLAYLEDHDWLGNPGNRVLVTFPGVQHNS